MKNWVRGIFDLENHQTNLKTELIAGLTTFLTMAYICFVNPNILKAAGMPFGAVMTATCLSAAVGSILMGIYANLPIALAPAMGTNAYFAFYVCGVMGINWQTALGAVFLSGVGFLLLTMTGLRVKIMDAIPDSMKHAVAAGIGIFIAFVGLQQAGVIVKNEQVLVGLGNVSSREVLVTLAGFLITGFFLARKIKGALMWGILTTTALAIAVGVSRMPEAILSMPPSMSETFGAMDIKAAFGIGLLQIVFAFLFVDLFDTLATLIAVSDQGGLMKTGSDGRLHLPRAGRALTSDAIATIAGSVFGTSTTTSYIESTAGIAAGGKTGLTSVVVGLLFLLMLFISPVIGVVPAQATAPALVIVCIFMMKSLVKIDWNDYTEAIPAVVTCLAIPLTFSISNGLALGFLLYPILKLVTGRWRETNWMVYLLGALFMCKFIFLGSSGE